METRKIKTLVFRFFFNGANCRLIFIFLRVPLKNNGFDDNLG